MKTLTDFLQKVDSIVPDPWHIDGVRQSRPTTQLGFLIGVIITLGVIYFFGIDMTIS